VLCVHQKFWHRASVKRGLTLDPRLQQSLAFAVEFSVELSNETERFGR
jgi:hypothetical protein